MALIVAASSFSKAIFPSKGRFRPIAIQDYLNSTVPDIFEKSKEKKPFFSLYTVRQLIKSMYGSVDELYRRVLKEIVAMEKSDSHEEIDVEESCCPVCYDRCEGLLFCVNGHSFCRRCKLWKKGCPFCFSQLE